MGYSIVSNPRPPAGNPHSDNFVTQTVDPNDTVQGQLVGLLDSNSAYIQQAKNQAAQQANSRGLLNSSIAAGAGQGAAIRAGLPIASQDAQTNAGVDASNANTMNQFYAQQREAQIANAAGAGARAAANAQASMQLEIAKMNAANQAAQLAEQARQFDASQSFKQSTYDTDWQHQQQMYGTDWQHQQQTMQQQNQMNQQNYLYTGLFSNVMNNPDMWSDPQAAMGFANYFASNFNDLWSSMFGGGALPATSTP